jgi:bifunctional NMN adenylyltransferase/nudix hydrolase
VKEVETKYDVGVVIGRFQVHDLHAGHRSLIQHAVDRHNKVLVVVGLAPVRGTQSQPLDFEARKQMILAEYPQVTTLYIDDEPTDAGWSKHLDKNISRHLTPNQSVILYGSRDSFISHYHGHYKTQALEPDSYLSGTEDRKRIASGSTKASGDFRAGAIWQAFNRFPTVYPTVDIAILDDREERILLGRKPTETAFRFVGGFIDPTDINAEAAARREVFEETNISITDPRYVASLAVDDWRYRNEVDQIMTTLYAAHYLSGAVRPGDDIAEAKWFALDTLTKADIVETHWPLLERLQTYVS